MSPLKPARSVISGSRAPLGARLTGIRSEKNLVNHHKESPVSRPAGTFLLMHHPVIQAGIKNIGSRFKKFGNSFKDFTQPQLVTPEGLKAPFTNAEELPQVFQTQGAARSVSHSFLVNENIRESDLDFAGLADLLARYSGAKLNSIYYRGIQTEVAAHQLRDALVEGIYDVQGYAGKGGLFPDFKNVTEVQYLSPRHVKYHAEVNLPVIPNAHLLNSLELQEVPNHPDVTIVDFRTVGIKGPVKSMQGQWLLKVQKGIDGFDVIVVHQGQLEIKVVPTFIFNLFNQTKKVCETLTILAKRVNLEMKK